MLASSDPYLRRCYDYIEEARGDETSYFVPLYKFIETFKKALGAEVRTSGERKLKRPVEKLLDRLNVKKPVDDLKAFYNEQFD